MSFFSGLGGFIGNAITPLNQAMAARYQGQIAGQQRSLQNALQMYAVQKQQEQLNMQRALQNSEINKNASLARSADALADYRSNGGPISVQWYQGDDGSSIPMVTRAPSSYFRNNGMGAPTPQGAPIQSTPFAPPTTNDLTSGLRGGPQQPTGQPSQAPTQQPPGVPITTQPRIVSRLGAPVAKQAPPKTINTAQGVQQWDPATQSWKSTGLTPFSPPPTNTYITGTGANGPEIFAGTSKGPPSLTPMGVAKPAAGAGGTGTGAQTSLPDLLRTHLALSADENDPNFKPSYTQQLREGVNYGLRQDQVKGTVPGFGQAVLGIGLNSFMNADPRQVGYMQNGRSWGEDASNAWKGRTNEERVIRDINTGTLNASNSGMPNVTQQLQSRRQNVIAMTALANPAQFAALDPQSHAIIQAYISHLPPDAVKAAQQSARDIQIQGGGRGGGGTPQTASGLTPAQIARAQSEPEYAAFLKATGKLP